MKHLHYSLQELSAVSVWPSRWLHPTSPLLFTMYSTHLASNTTEYFFPFHNCIHRFCIISVPAFFFTRRLCFWNSFVPCASSVSTLAAAHFYSVKILHLFLIHSVTNGHWDCIWFLEIIKKTSVKTFIHGFCYTQLITVFSSLSVYSLLAVWVFGNLLLFKIRLWILSDWLVVVIYHRQYSRCKHILQITHLFLWIDSFLLEIEFF